MIDPSHPSPLLNPKLTLEMLSFFELEEVIYKVSLLQEKEKGRGSGEKKEGEEKAVLLSTLKEAPFVSLMFGAGDFYQEPISRPYIRGGEGGEGGEGEGKRGDDGGGEGSEKKAMVLFANHHVATDPDFTSKFSQQLKLKCTSLSTAPITTTSSSSSAFHCTFLKFVLILDGKESFQPFANLFSLGQAIQLLQSQGVLSPSLLLHLVLSPFIFFLSLISPLLS